MEEKEQRQKRYSVIKRVFEDDTYKEVERYETDSYAGACYSLKSLPMDLLDVDQGVFLMHQAALERALEMERKSSTGVVRVSCEKVSYEMVDNERQPQEPYLKFIKKNLTYEEWSSVHNILTFDDEEDLEGSDYELAEEAMKLLQEIKEEAEEWILRLQQYKGTMPYEDSTEAAQTRGTSNA